MARVLITGMYGAGETTLLDEVRRRGHRAVDTDYDGWELPDGTWDEPRMDRLLAGNSGLVVSGTVPNQVAFYDRFEHVVLRNAPPEVLLDRVMQRTCIGREDPNATCLAARVTDLGSGRGDARLEAGPNDH